jgi:hypothetical protein
MKGSKYDISIIICTYNRAKKIRNTIKSILNTEIPAELKVELIVVNNGSTDDTDNVIKNLENDNTKIELKLIHETKSGKSNALNKALEYVSGDIIVFTDDDVTVDKKWLVEINSACKRYPECNCFGGKIVAIYPPYIPEWLDINNSMKFLKSVFVDRDEGNKEVVYSEKTVSKTPGGANMFLRKRIIDKIGLFNTELGPTWDYLGFSEDTEYCQRILSCGEKIMYIPSVIVYHPVYEERLTKQYLLKWQYFCGRSEVRRVNGYRYENKILGVPIYLFNKIIQHFFKWGFSFNNKKRFYHRLKFYYTAGEITEHLKLTFK